MMQLTGYETIGPAGFGAGGAAWNVRAADGTPAVAIRTEAEAGRLATLQALRHPSLPGVLSVHRAAEGGVMVMELVAGVRLGVVMGARAWASPAEVAGLWRNIGDAVAALHHRGIAHGDISPANIVMADAGRPVLIDIAGHGGAELGHEGFIPPEGRGGTASAGDVWSLARTLLWVSGDDATIRRLLGRALAADPSDRPTAREFALGWSALGDPESLALPAASRLAEAGMRNDDGETWLGTPERRSRWWIPTAVAAALGVGLGVAGVLAAGPDPATEAAGNDQILRLVQVRDTAIQQLDEGMLDAVFAPGGSAAAADRELIGGLAALSVQATGYETRVHDVTVLRDDDGGVTAVLEISPSAYERVHADGTRERVAEGAIRCVQLQVVNELITAIEPCE